MHFNFPSAAIETQHNTVGRWNLFSVCKRANVQKPIEKRRRCKPTSTTNNLEVERQQWGRQFGAHGGGGRFQLCLQRAGSPGARLHFPNLIE